MLKKFRHYALDFIDEFEVSNGMVKIDEKFYKLVPFMKTVIAEGTSWVKE